MRNVTIGIDLGDKNHIITILDEAGVIVKSCSLENVRASIVKFFRKYKGSTVAIEAGTHSPWISRELKALGCNVLVGNPRKLRKMPEVRNPRYVPPAEDFWKVYDLTEGQDRVMLLTFLHTAGRRGEIFRLTVADLDFENNRIRLSTKKRTGGNLEYDWLPMTAELKRELSWWLENRPLKNKPHLFMCLEERPFHFEHYGEPFQFRAKFMKTLCAKAGVKPFGFHAIRHLTASQLYSMGYSVATIQALLRHKSAGTTERYLRTLGLEHIRDAMEGLSAMGGKFTVADSGVERKDRPECRH